MKREERNDKNRIEMKTTVKIKEKERGNERRSGWKLLGLGLEMEGRN